MKALKQYQDDQGNLWLGRNRLGRNHGQEYVRMDSKGYTTLWDSNEDTNGNAYLSCSGSGFGLDNLESLKNEDVEFIERAYTTNSGLYCSECSQFHDGDDDQYPDCPFTIRDCEVYCLECVPDELRLQEVNNAKDIFKAPRVDIGTLPKAFKEVETLFCDSSGFGSPGERALTKDQCVAHVAKLLTKRKPLYAGLTGVGQFQVYVTLYTKRGGK